MSIGTTVFILAWVVCALVGVAIGCAKNRLVLGALLGAAGGLIGVAIIACIPKKEESEPPVLTTNDLHQRRRSIVVLSIVYALLGLLLLPWPVASFTAIFLFDAPILVLATRFLVIWRPSRFGSIQFFMASHS